MSSPLPLNPNQPEIAILTRKPQQKALALLIPQPNHATAAIAL